MLATLLTGSESLWERGYQMITADRGFSFVFRQCPFSASFNHGPRKALWYEWIAFCFLIALVFLWWAPPMQAQYRTSIQGTVTDPSGAVVSGATVTLTNNETNQSLQATTQ